MPQARQAPDRAAAAGRWALIVGGLAALAMAALALRTLAVELSLPPELRLDELRLFRVADVQPTDPLFANAIQDPLHVHAGFATCEAKLRQAGKVYDFGGQQVARAECLSVVESALSLSPTNGRLWLERARLIYEISGPSPAFAQSLAASWKTAPRAGWIALERLRFAAAVWPFLPEEMRGLAANDAHVIASSRRMAMALAREYANYVSVRPALAEIISRRLPGKAQRQLIDAFRQAAQ